VTRRRRSVPEAEPAVHRLAHKAVEAVTTNPPVMPAGFSCHQNAPPPANDWGSWRRRRGHAGRARGLCRRVPM
jgi:hypothetical protein